MSRKPPDPIEQLIEWEEHQYNPGYWINRVPPYFPPRRTRQFWIVALIDAVAIVAAFLALLWSLFYEHNHAVSGAATLMGLFSLVALLRLWRLWPDSSSASEVQSQSNQRKKERKKRLPRRRKDYK